jgi:hypothetical protein
VAGGVVIPPGSAGTTATGTPGTVPGIATTGTGTTVTGGVTGTTGATGTGLVAPTATAPVVSGVTVAAPITTGVVAAPAAGVVAAPAAGAATTGILPGTSIVFGAQPADVPVPPAVVPPAILAAPNAGAASIPNAAGRDFAAKVAQLSQQADQVDRLWLEFKTTCMRSDTQLVNVRERYETAREWLALWEEVATPEESPARCDDLFDRVVDASDPINREMAAAEDMARRFGLLPGAIREIEQLYRMDWGQWGRPRPAVRGTASR